MLEKAIAIGAVNRGNIENFGVIQALLNPGSDGVIIIFGFDDSDWNFRLVIQDEISAFALAASGTVAAYINPPIGEENFFANLSLQIPACFDEIRQNEF